jgi:hypothetical protein
MRLDRLQINAFSFVKKNYAQEYFLFLQRFNNEQFFLPTSRLKVFC